MTETGFPSEHRTSEVMFPEGFSGTTVHFYYFIPVFSKLLHPWSIASLYTDWFKEHSIAPGYWWMHAVGMCDSGQHETPFSGDSLLHYPGVLHPHSQSGACDLNASASQQQLLASGDVNWFKEVGPEPSHRQ